MLTRFKLSPEKLVAQTIDSKDKTLLSGLTSGDDLRTAKTSALQVSEVSAPAHQFWR